MGIFTKSRGCKGNVRKIAKETLRAARFETLEERQLLSVNTLHGTTGYDNLYGRGAYAEIQAAYPTLNLPSGNKYNVVVIDGDDINASTIQDQVALNPQHSIFIIRTDAEHNTITAPAGSTGASALTLTPGVDFYFVAWSGSAENNIPLTIDGQDQYRACEIGGQSKNSKLGFANLSFVRGYAVGEGESGVGAGLYLHNTMSAFYFSNCNFDLNTASYGGGVFYQPYPETGSRPANSGSLTLKWCNFTNNYADGGAAFDDDDYAQDVMKAYYNETIDGCTFFDNVSASSIVHTQCNITMLNSSFGQNVLDGEGGNGVFYVRNYEPLNVTNCTFAFNHVHSTTDEPFASVYVDYNPNSPDNPVHFNNCIIVETDGGIDLYHNPDASTITASNCVTTFEDWDSETNCIHYEYGDYLFAYPNTHDLTLHERSYAVDAGSNSLAQAAGLTANTYDLAGNARIQNGTIDIGAYEGGVRPVAPDVDYRIIVTLDEDRELDHSDDFDADGTPLYISVRDAYDYIGKRFDRDKYNAGYYIEDNYFVYDQTTVWQCWVDCEDPAQYPAAYNEAREYISGVYDTIYFQDYVCVDAREDVRELNCVVFSAQLAIEKSLTVDGVRSEGFADVALNGAGESRIFTVETGANVSLKNLKFQSGLADCGGALYVRQGAQVSASNIVFSVNEAERYGGAVYNAGQFVINVGAVSADDALAAYFVGNNAALGGAIYNAAGAVLTIEGSAEAPVLFADCKAISDASDKYGSGGAVYNSSSAGRAGALTASNIFFTECEADKYGGAISNYGTAYVENGQFEGNKASAGGAIQNAGSLLVSGNNTFTQNEAAGKNGNGGAIYSSNNGSAGTEGTLFIGGVCEFTSNTASNAGGAIDVVSGAIGLGTDQDGESASFTNNAAGNIGGAIVLGVESMTTTFTDSVQTDGFFQFAGNTAAYGQTVAANVKATDAKELVEAFGFDYANVKTDEFAPFMKIASNVKDGSLTFEYFCGLLDGAVEASAITVSCGQNAKTIAAGESVSFSELGIGSEGTYKINAEFDSGTTCSVLIKTVGDYSVAVRKTMLMNEPNIPCFSFNLYNAAASAWKIVWDAENESDYEEFNGLSSTFTASHIYEEDKTHTVAVEADVDGKTVRFQFTYDSQQRINFADASAALIEEAFKSDDLFDEYFV